MIGKLTILSDRTFFSLTEVMQTLKYIGRGRVSCGIVVNQLSPDIALRLVTIKFSYVCNAVPGIVTVDYLKLIR